jgi:phosphoglycolate phosphatase
LDLDGTLTDPSDGITKCFRYAMECLDRPIPAVAELLQFIGPPLRRSFSCLLDGEGPELIEAGLSHYRRRYSSVGIFELEVYPGIVPALQALRAAGLPLYIVTSKPAVYAKRIVEHFGWTDYFEDVYGPELDGRFDAKTDLIAHIFEQTSLVPARCVMIGDRASDVAAGRANGTRTISVTYGFGSVEELTAAGPDAICAGADAIQAAVLDVFSAV